MNMNARAEAGNALADCAFARRFAETVADNEIIRRLAAEVAQVAARPIQNQRRQLWRNHNSLRPGRPLINMRGGVCMQETLNPWLQCRDPFFRHYEFVLRDALLRDWIDDDMVVEPWLNLRAVPVLPPAGHWGVKIEREHSAEAHGSFRWNPPLKEWADLAQLVKPRHEIDEEATARNYERLSAAVGAELPLNLDRSPHWTVWAGDISTDLAYLRGLEQVMWDMADEPERLHELLAFMRDGILAAHEQAEAAGDWGLANHQNQSMPYCQELADPQANRGPVKRSELWAFCAAQELTLVSPAMHDEFMFQYQMPILKHFGLVAYGCCEDLTHKIDMLRQLPNLRRIAVTPVANVARCAEQIGGDYVASYRPNPASMVCCGFDEERIRRILCEHLAAFKANGCVVDICLKDVQTVEGEPWRLRRFVELAREAAAGYA